MASSARFGLILILTGLWACEGEPPPSHITAEIGGLKFNLELAISNEKIERGMMGRESIGETDGMLFAFPDEKVRYFWMKNCLIPLDVVFLDSRGRIVAMMTMPVPSEDEADDPPRHSSRWPAQFAVELKAGRSMQLELETGQFIELPLERLKKWAR